MIFATVIVHNFRQFEKRHKTPPRTHVLIIDAALPICLTCLPTLELNRSLALTDKLNKLDRSLGSISSDFLL